MSALAEKHAKAMARRDAAIRRQRASGRSVARIAREYGLTRQRVYQIVKS